MSLVLSSINLLSLSTLVYQLTKHSLTHQPRELELDNRLLFFFPLLLLISQSHIQLTLYITAKYSSNTLLLHRLRLTPILVLLTIARRKTYLPTNSIYTNYTW